MIDEAKRMKELVASVQYSNELFNVYIGANKCIMGFVSVSPSNNFFVYKTIYDTIIDLDEKIKKSFELAIDWEYRSDIDNFNMFSPPSKVEKEAIYYTENAIFRTSVLWDMLAQLYNIKYKNNQAPDKVYYNILFHNEAQGKHSNQFAVEVYTYISEDEEEDEDHNYEVGEMWKGNHKYVTNYRNKMTHRNSPNISTISNYDIELRMPMRYVLKRCIEDYVQVSKFIKQLIDIILK